MSHPKDLAAKASAAFRNTFAAAPAVIAAAPGRVNLIGEHTDYNDGFVLPMAIGRHTCIVANPNSSNTAVIHADGFPGIATIDLDQPITPGEPSWSNYVRGVLSLMIERAIDIPGFDAIITSNVPTGAGLSSSAALEVATATLVEALTNHPIDPVEKALLCQQAEHTFAGMPCGIMDQFISTMGQADHALLIDCRSHTTRQVKLDDPDLAVLIIDSKAKHALVDGEYAQRRQACEQAAKALNVDALRDATMNDLDQAKNRLDETTFRRARHVITENQRTRAAADLADKNDWASFGQLMLQSHASMRDDFEITTPELDRLVELATACGPEHVHGSRMTGGGFGGATVSLVKADTATETAQRITDQYLAETGIQTKGFITQPSDGGQILH
ncbi:galactokinase [Mucisphaera sp.]|uniref:galactokinase n=1 Tax=Mucisphaera sp. TaxID=2913024 RepID=UPI003D10E34C